MEGCGLFFVSNNDSSIYRGRSFNRRTVVYSPHFSFISFSIRVSIRTADFNSSIKRSTTERQTMQKKKKKKEKASCVERAAKGCRVGEGEKRGKRGRRRGAGERVD